MLCKCLHLSLTMCFLLFRAKTSLKLWQSALTLHGLGGKLCNYNHWCQQQHKHTCGLKCKLYEVPRHSQRSAHHIPPAPQTMQ